MAFATSSSAFGMKPTIATGSSIFGQPNSTGNNAFGASQPQANNNPFGQQSTQQPATGSIFGQPQQQQQAPAAGSSLFGQPAGQQSGSSLFGQPATGGNIFGQQGTNNTQQAGTSLFGNTNNTNTQQQQQQPAFGTNTNTSGSSLFGQPSQQPAAGTSSIFGQSTQAPSLFGQQPAATSSVFGQPAQQQQQQQPQQQQQGSSIFGGGGGTSIFGNNNATGSNTGAFGGSTFGGGSSMFNPKPTQPQQSTFGAPAVQQPSGPPPFSKTTKFNDLPDALKQTFEKIDSHIQGRILISKDLRVKKLGEEATKGQELIRVVNKDFSNTSTTIRNDLHFTRDLKAKADQAVHDTIISTRIVDGFKNSQLSAYLKDHASFPLEFFMRITNQIRERLVWYRATIEQIERKLSSMANQTHTTPQGITTTVQAQHATFLALASKTAALDAELQKIKALYTHLWRTRTGSVRDPFDGVGVNDSQGKSDLGLSGLSVR